MGRQTVSRKLAPKVAPPDKAEAYSDKDKWLKIFKGESIACFSDARVEGIGCTKGGISSCKTACGSTVVS
ncbi:hypothetical protein ACV6EA_01585 [Enterococcus hirae]